MKESTRKKWVPMAVVFLSVFGSFAALMYLSITTFSTVQNRPNSPFFRFQQSPVNWRMAPEATQAADRPAPTTAGWYKVALFLDKEVRVGGALLTYRGLGEGSTFKIDAIIPDLDSQYAYRQQFDIEHARKGFKSGGERLRLISAGRYKMRLTYYIPAR